MMVTLTAIIAQLLVSYTPGNEKWEDQKDMDKAVKAMALEDRPLPPEKTDAYPFGVINVDEGTKKGIIQMFKAMQECSTMTEEQWSANVKLNQGDWLTSNNTRAAKWD